MFTINEMHRYNNNPHEMSCENDLSSLFNKLIENLNLVLDQIKADDVSQKEMDDFNLDAFWNHINTCMKVVSQEATKLSLACSQSPLPSAKDAQPLINGIEQSSLALVSAHYSLPVCQGHTLRRYITDSLVGVVGAAIGLVQSFQISKQQEQKRYLQLTGSVWEIVDKFPNLPRDNKDAVICRTNESIQLISDALEELEEALKSSSEESLDEIDNIEDDLNFSEVKWKDTERTVVTACIGLVKTAKAGGKKLIKAIQCNGRCNNEDTIKELDEFCQQMALLSPAVDELVSCLYPPIQPEIISTNVNQLASVTHDLLSKSKSLHFILEGDMSWMDFLFKAIEHNSTKSTHAISAYTV